MKNQAKVIAAAFALLGFAVAMLAGIAADNPASIVLVRSLLLMILCHVVGTAAGAMLGHVIEEHVHAYELSHPVPEVSLSPTLTDSKVSPPSGNEKISQNISSRSSSG